MAPDDRQIHNADKIERLNSEWETANQSYIVIWEAVGCGVLMFYILSASILAERSTIQDDSRTSFITALTGAIAFLATSWVLSRPRKNWFNPSRLKASAPPAPAFFNPALSFAFALNERFSLGMAILCATSQIAAAFLGVMLAHLSLNTGLIQNATQIQSGLGVWAGEFIGTALFVFTMLWAARTTPQRAPFIGALTLFAIALATPSTSFANPAFTLARSLTDSFTAIRLSDALIIAGVQMLAALCAWGFCAWLAKAKANQS